MNILIVGLGSIAKKHIAAIYEIGVEHTLYAWRSSPTAAPFLNVKNIFNFQDIKIIAWDFAIIANPTSKHKETIEQLLELNCPLFIEKPIYHTLDIESLISKVQNRGILTYVACNLRFLDCLRFVKNRIEQENPRINEINVYCGSYIPEWRPGTDYQKCYSTNQSMGGGVHLDLIHELDYVFWLWGSPLKTTSTLKSNSSLNINAYDYANYLLDYDEFCANVVLNYYRRDIKRTLEIVFEENTWEINLLKNQITCNNQMIFSSEQLIVDTYQTQMEYFLTCLSKKTNSFNAITDAYSVLKICLEQ